MLGGVVGSMLEGQETQSKFGPRLGDLTVTNSAYGSMVPMVWGTARIAGNVIWAADMVETGHTSGGGGGKGGGGGGSQTTTYTYSDSFALSLGEGPIVGLRRIWLNGVVWWEIKPTPTIDVGSATWVQGLGFKFYSGDETQLPDPTIESYLGVGNVPAYRGQAYLVFTDLQLADYGNRIPNVTVEVVRNGATTVSLKKISSITGPSGNYGSKIVMGDRMFALNGANVNVYSIAGNTTPVLEKTIPMGFTVVWIAVLGGDLLVWGGGNVLRYGVKFGSTLELYSTTPGTATRAEVNDDGQYVYAVNNSGYLDVVNAKSSLSSRVESRIPLPGAGDVMYFDPSTKRLIVASYAASNIVIYDTSNPGLPVYLGVISPAYATAGIEVALYKNHVYASCRASSSLLVWDITNPAVPVYKTSRGLGGGSGWQTAGWLCLDGRILYASKYNTGVAGAQGTATTPYDLTNPAEPLALSTDVVTPNYTVGIVARGGVVWQFTNAGVLITGKLVIEAPEPSPESLSVIVSELLRVANIPSNRIEASALTTLVQGYVVSRQAPIRDVLEMLRNAYNYDIVESAGTVKCVNRFGASVLTLNSNEHILEGSA